ncbi:hypothetical protein BJ944DRAFT_234269 [Cunninghamella echinulata]|nr:hypothetical protein BJ944DRAFT_234269 [Cunninghamella echinulata]
MSEFKRRREEIQETAADIFKYDNKKEYSGLDCEKVLEYLGTKNDILFAKDANINEKDIDKKAIDYITEGLIFTTKAYGIVNSGNESKRQEFISSIIKRIVAEYYDKNVRIKKEFYIESNDVRGLVEYVISNSKYILIIIETKNAFDQGEVWEFVWCTGNNNIHTIEDVGSNIIWNYKDKIQPIEKKFRKEKRRMGK